MKKFIYLALLLVIGSRLQYAVASDFKFKAGLGYDFISQEYFLDSLITSGIDSGFTQFQLTNDYLDDARGIFQVSYRPGQSRDFELTGKIEQTKDYLRLRQFNSIYTKLGSSNLLLNTELDYRDKQSDDSNLGNSYINGELYAKLKSPLSRSLYSIVQVESELVDFKDNSAFSYDYNRIGGKIGLEKNFENFSFANIKLFYLHRAVPDSGALAYNQYGLENSYLGFYAKGEVDLFSRLEYKDYNSPDNQDDYLRLYLTAHNKYRLKNGYFFKQNLDLEWFNYGDEEILNQDNWQPKLQLLLGWENADLSLAAGAHFEMYQELNDSLFYSQSYFESGGMVEFDLFKIDRIFLSAESISGFRNYYQNDELQTDFGFERLNLFGELKIYQGLDFNFLFSTEFEWHELKSNDTRIYLLSSSLTYSF